MNSKERIQAALACREVDRTPVWFMRQAGRYLPEYRELKQRYSFREMVQHPELATEVTLQPMRRFSQIDAAIVFSDILVIPEALGMDYHFREGGGIAMEWRVSDFRDLERLQVGDIEEKLNYVFEALSNVHRELADQRALFGFGGSPWTLASYMIEGGSSQQFERLKLMAFEHPALLEALLERITEALVLYFRRMQQCGVSAIQIFDSWGSVCPGAFYEAWSLKWIRRIIQEVGHAVPFILFSKGMGAHLDLWRTSGASVFSMDASMNLQNFLPDTERGFAIQGNLDPIVLSLGPEAARRATRAILGDGAPWRGHIFNLGHGILPTARIDSVEAMLEEVVQSTNGSVG